MKGRAAFLLALTGTIFGMSANLHSVAQCEPGAGTFAVTLCVAALWLVCSALCAQNPVLCRVSPALLTVLAAVGLLGLVPAITQFKAGELAWMLAAAPFYGLGAICVGEAQNAIAGAALCAFIGLLHLSGRRRALLREDQDILALEREMLEPSFDPGLAPAIERKTKKLLGLRDPAERLGGKS